MLVSEQRKQLRLRLNHKKEWLFFSCLREVAEQTSFEEMDQYIQHGHTSCMFHSYAVAYYSLYVASKFHIRCNERGLVRGALLHDYILYDWHENDRSHRFHGFHHPKRALANAKRDLELSKIEEDLIKHHMFPLTICPPLCREAMIVCIIDKIFSVYELRRRKRYEELFALWKQQYA